MKQEETPSTSAYYGSLRVLRGRGSTLDNPIVTISNGPWKEHGKAGMWKWS